jgi:DNA repair protein RecN (Recombination protein N)
MLSRLTITNYALIDELTVNYESGLNIITGETGAGKSIILGALSLILGARADAASLRDATRKCVVEGVFRVEELALEPFFEKNDLDYEPVTILRREILTTGKSRAFVNDTPVNLQQLRELTLRLIDIHSQHQNLELGNRKFQLQIVDTVARTGELLVKYRREFDLAEALSAKLAMLRETAIRAKADLDYHVFQHHQLQEARFEAGEQASLEDERNRLAHAEEIKTALGNVSGILDGDHFPVLQQIRDAIRWMDRIRNYVHEASAYHARLESAYLELQDLARETGYLAESTEFHPARLAEVNERLDLIYNLLQKHQLTTVEELIALRDDLALKIDEVNGYDEEIGHTEVLLASARQSLVSAAALLSEARINAFPAIEKQVSEVLMQLGMPHAVFKVIRQPSATYGVSGNDDIQFLFSASKNTLPDEISRIASGGEISRLMLAVKTLVSGSLMLPTIIFDEIDSGVSGEVALRMGTILKKLSAGMQVINITHLPQIAGKGDHHYKVYKLENETATITSIRKLTHNERIEELATMVGGDNPSETARKTARELMQAV